MTTEFIAEIADLSAARVYILSDAEHVICAPVAREKKERPVSIRFTPIW